MIWKFRTISNIMFLKSYEMFPTFLPSSSPCSSKLRTFSYFSKMNFKIFSPNFLQFLWSFGKISSKRFKISMKLFQNIRNNFLKIHVHFFQIYRKIEKNVCLSKTCLKISNLSNYFKISTNPSKFASIFFFFFLFFFL